MQPSCLYHPTDGVRVFTDEVEHEKALESGFWFQHPKDAENMRADYENEQNEQNEQIKQPSKQVKSSRRRERVHPEKPSDGIIDGGESSEVGSCDEAN